MARPWRFEEARDQLWVFVSSRLAECADERAAARQAILATRHKPVLFEHMGARPYSARDLYLSRLAESDAMVAIYRLGYGFVDAENGMDVSGVEDEYRHAKLLKIDTLLYVHRSGSGRDPRLSALIEDAQTFIVPSTYGDASELEARIADDLTALITRRCRGVSMQRAAQEDSADRVLRRHASRTGNQAADPQLLARLGSMVEENPIVVVSGAPGVGKTLLAASFAAETGALFVRLTSQAPKQMFETLTAVLKGVDVAQASSTDAGREEFIEAWNSRPAATLVIDDCSFAAEVVGAVVTAGKAAAGKRLVITAPEPIAETPSLRLLPSDLPGKLRPEAQLLSAASDNEIVAYLALAGSPLLAEELLDLRGDDNLTLASLYAQLKPFENILDDAPGGFSIVEDATRLAIVEEIAKRPQRHKFLLHRLVRLCETQGEWRRAYWLSVELNDGSEAELAHAALREAARLGDWRSGTDIADRLLSAAEAAGNRWEAFRAAIDLSYPLELMGRLDAADAMIHRAEELAEQLGIEAQEILREQRLRERARRGLRPEDLAELEQLHEKQGLEGDTWAQSVTAVELSALYMAAKEYEKSARIVRPAVEIFEALGDDVGVEAAKRNLAASLSFLPQHQAEADKLVAEVLASDRRDKRRERAWLNNILTRRYRESGRLEEAERLANEAIEIARELNDENLAAINSINLGNVLRDQGRIDDAVAAYDSAGLAAQKCRRRDVEGDAARLAAEALNDNAEESGKLELYSRAREYAMYAWALLEDSANLEGRARALLALARARHGLRDTVEAVRTYYQAAEALRLADDDVGSGIAVERAMRLALPEHAREHVVGLARLLQAPAPHEDAHLGETFVELIGAIVERAPKSSLFDILGLHLKTTIAELPPAARQEVLRIFVREIARLAKSEAHLESWRVKYAAIVAAALASEHKNRFLEHQLSRALSANGNGLYVRETGTGSLAWTVVVPLGRKVTISVTTLDDSPASNLAALSLAAFLSAFAEDWNAKIVNDAAAVDEIVVQVMQFDEMPADLQALTQRMSSQDVNDRPCTVTRPTKFGSGAPTFIILGKPFLETAVFGEGRGGSLQVLFGLSLVELTFQVLGGEIDEDELRPKIVSLVRRTMS